MIEEVLPHIYRIPVPLPNNPLRELNSYFIRGGGRDLLVDTGFRQAPSREALFEALRSLGYRADRTDVLLTHLHSDHAGLAPEVVGTGGHIFVSHTDKSYLEDFQSGNHESWKRTDAVFAAEGFLPALLADGINSNPARAMAPPPTDRYVGLADGQVIEVGDYRLTCILTPGHTPGHMCFRLEKEKAMLLGDHVLFDITPNITSWTGVADSLGDYLSSLRAIRSYDVAVPLPAHRGSGDFKARIDDLLAHHQVRLAETLDVVRAHPGQPAYVLAGHMTWKIRSNTWADFPVSQKWFAVGECVSHLEHLMVLGKVQRDTDETGLRRYYPIS
ncbi:MAG: MBL fold metallo-hydrolase [Clostridia bacterium]|nr:MBL fold metallo-hydrolase [Clostridia bacterium]